MLYFKGMSINHVYSFTKLLYLHLNPLINAQKFFEKISSVSMIILTIIWKVRTFLLNIWWGVVAGVLRNIYTLNLYPKYKFAYRILSKLLGCFWPL